jgi:hypothetical protein
MAAAPLPLTDNAKKQSELLGGEIPLRCFRVSDSWGRRSFRPPPTRPLAALGRLQIAMSRSVTATTNGTSSRKDRAVNGSANGSAPAGSKLENGPGYRDFFWTYTEEPHRTRRLAIIKAHPEVSIMAHLI